MKLSLWGDRTSSPTDEFGTLTTSTKLAYGVGTIGISMTGNILAFFVMFFFTDVVGLPPYLAGSILMIGKITDAINDPIIGWLGDRTRSRWGRRYPWIMFGAIPFCLSFAFLWIVPDWNQWVLFSYYAFMAVVYNTAYTAVFLPYVALTPELSQDYNERTSLNSFRFTFAIGSSLLSLSNGTGDFSSDSRLSPSVHGVGTMHRGDRPRFPLLVCPGNLEPSDGGRNTTVCGGASHLPVHRTTVSDYSPQSSLFVGNGHLSLRLVKCPAYGCDHALFCGELDALTV